MPFRLLGLAAAPDHVRDLCGQAFPRYAASGAEITLVCAASRGERATDLRPAVRALGVRDLVLLDYDSVRPHVVVADGQQQAVRDAAATAFSQSRSADSGSAALPAKLYYRAFGATPAVELTTAVAVPRPPSPELFVRVFPSPWVTGVLERDLFAGIPAERQPATVRERLAS